MEKARKQERAMLPAEVAEERKRFEQMEGAANKEAKTTKPNKQTSTLHETDYNPGFKNASENTTRKSSANHFCLGCL